MDELRRASRYCIALLLISISSKLYAAADTFIDFDVTAGLDDNVTRAEYNNDIEHDTFLAAGASLGHEYWQSGQASVVLNAGVTADKFIDFNGLSNIAATAGATFTHGFSPGFGAPWLSVNASYTVREFESFLRDSDIYFAAVTVGKRIDDRTDLRSAVAYKKRESDGVVFDTEDVSWFVNIDWTIMDKTTLYTTYKIQKGDAFSSATPSVLGLDIINASDAIEPDDVFTDKITYRLDSTIHFVTVGFNRALDLHSSWDISARFLKATAEDDVVEYEGLLVRASYFYRYGL